MSRLNWKMGDVIWLPHTEIKPYVNNNKEHPDKQIEKIMLQIVKFGFDVPLVLNKDHVIIKGHGRHIACKKLNIKMPCIIREDLSEEEEMALRIADNAVARSDWDEDNLKFELGTLQRAEFDLELTGLEEKEISKYLEEDPIITKDFTGKEEASKEYKVIVTLKTEGEMAELYTELKNRGLECALVA